MKGAGKKLQRARAAAAEQKRKAMKLRAVPAWANMDIITTIYKIAGAYRKAGFDVQVDHIVPLLSPLVCGLHTEQNLQLLWAHDNLTKSNRVWPDMP